MQTVFKSYFNWIQPELFPAQGWKVCFWGERGERKKSYLLSSSERYICGLLRFHKPKIRFLIFNALELNLSDVWWIIDEMIYEFHHWYCGFCGVLWVFENLIAGGDSRFIINLWLVNRFNYDMNSKHFKPTKTSSTINVNFSQSVSCIHAVIVSHSLY